MSEQAIDDLEEIAKRLAPGLWLSMDQAAIERYFGYGPAAYATAEAWARKLHCVFIRDGNFIKLSKAYPELGRDA